MGGELVPVGNTLLDVVKAAARLDLHDDPEPFPCSISPSWIAELNDVKKAKDQQVEDPENEVGSILRREHIGLTGEGVLRPIDEEEKVLVRKLMDILKQPADLSMRSFLDLLGAHLRRVKFGATPDDRFTVELDVRSTLELLKESAGLLGRSLVVVLLECAILLKFWALVRVLLESRVVISNSCSKLVQSLVEDEQALALCLYASNVPDLSPQDIYLMLTLFLDNVESPSRPFESVRREWKRIALVEIKEAGKNKDAIQAATKNSWFHKLDELSRYHEHLVSSAIGVSMAVDGFSSPECCLHHLLAAGLDEAVLSSVISRLNFLQILNLLQYLAKWVERYVASRQSFQNCDNKRVPSLEQILSWAGVLLEGHFTTIVLSSDCHKEIRHLRDLVQSLVGLGTSLYPLGGIVEHIQSHALLPVGKQQGVADSGYVIELLDMS